MSTSAKSVLFVLALWLIETTAAHADDLAIVEAGRSDYVIVVAQDAIPAEKFAAAELAFHVKEMSGADLRIVSDTDPLPERAILLGRPRHLADLGVAPDWSQMGQEGYLIRTLPDHLIIAGGRPRGTMYGVYDLLQEHWGCRWFTFDTRSIPKQTTLALPALDAVRRPAFELRDLMIVSDPYVYGGWFNHHRDEKHFARLRWNFVTRDFRHTDESHGGSFRIASLAHNYRWLVPPEIHGAEHPEYFALDNGKRLNHELGPNQVELCLSNPQVAEVAAQTIAGWLQERPDCEMSFIGQSDTAYYCKCNRCESTRRRYGGWDSARRVQIPADLPEDRWNHFGGFAGWQIEFVNRVAVILEKRFPNVRVGTFAYLRARRPPRGIRAHPNVVVWYCPFYDGLGYPVRCYCHSVDSGPLNDEFENFGDELGAWRGVANHIYVYDYWLGTWMGQPVNIPTLRRTMRFYRKAGVSGVLLDGMRGIPGGFEWLTFWLWSQLAWNPDFDADQGIDDFCNAYYGAAGPYIKQYVALACRPDSYSMASVPIFRAGTGRHRTKRFTDDPYKPIKLEKLRSCQLGFRYRAMTTTAIERGYELFEKAREAVANDPKALKHVEHARMPLQHAMLTWLPGTDPRLKDETDLLIQLAKELEIPAIGYGAMPHARYREAMRKKIELGAPLYPPKSPAPPAGKESAFATTPPAKARYLDGADYRDLLPKLRLVADLPVAGWTFKDDPEAVGVERGYHRPSYAADDFDGIQIGKHWDAQGHVNLTEGWYRLRMRCPQLAGASEGKRVFLHFAAVDESAWLYIDGKLVAWYDTAYPQITWDKPFLLEVTGSLKSQHEHLVAIRVGNTIGAGGIWKPVSLMVEK